MTFFPNKLIASCNVTMLCKHFIFVLYVNSLVGVYCTNKHQIYSYLNSVEAYESNIFNLLPQNII
jgi:hypothetical protein